MEELGHTKYRGIDMGNNQRKKEAARLHNEKREREAIERRERAIQRASQPPRKPSRNRTMLLAQLLAISAAASCGSDLDYMAKSIPSTEGVEE